MEDADKLSSLKTLATVVWLVYRIVKGWLNLNDDRSMAA